MKSYITVAFLFLSHVTQAAETSRYFNGNDFESIKSVQIVGVPRTPENVERERQIGEIVAQNARQFRYCFEKLLLGGPIPQVSPTFYFTVDEDGSFNNVTADLPPQGENQEKALELISCSAKRISTFRAPSRWGAIRTFRFNMTFLVGQ